MLTFACWPIRCGVQQLRGGDKRGFENERLKGVSPLYLSAKQQGIGYSVGPPELSAAGRWSGIAVRNRRKVVKCEQLLQKVE